MCDGLIVNSRVRHGLAPVRAIRHPAGMNSGPTELTSENIMDPHRWFMRKALALAARAAEAGEVPVGAVITHRGKLIAQAYNQVELLKDPTAHAEMIAITQATAAVGDWRLGDCILYVTKEPCPMCAGAIVLARIPLVVWGMSDPQRGGAVSRFQIFQSDNLNHRVECQTGIMEEECKAMMVDFFRQRRQENDRARTARELEERKPDAEGAN